MTRKGTTSETKIDLSACDREPIQIPGSIQPHGMLLTLKAPDLTVLQASENIAALGDFSLDALPGLALEAIFGQEVSQTLRADISATPLGTNPVFLRPLTLSVRGEERSYNAIAHRHDEVCQPASNIDPPSASNFDPPQALSERSLCRRFGS